MKYAVLAYLFINQGFWELAGVPALYAFGLRPETSPQMFHAVTIDLATTLPLLLFLAGACYSWKAVFVKRAHAVAFPGAQ